MKKFLLLLSFLFFAWILTFCNNQSSTEPTFPTEPTTSDTICFESQILPLLRFNCATSGCHDATSATAGVVTEDYTTIRATVTPNDLANSKLYLAIRTGAHQGVRLDQDQVELIQNWILQGANNTTNCSGVTAFVCDTNSFTYNNAVKIILDKECVSCHNINVSNSTVRLDTYDEVRKVATSGALIGVIDWLTGWRPMPQGRPQLPDCERTVIRKWIEDGMPNN
ncbi:hypothetical protein BKI52_04045 [marine bacterium AO1-C]|nr:hypothetical protein BKI52_04045 [marine bacterium AO1-C]